MAPDCLSKWLGGRCLESELKHFASNSPHKNRQHQVAKESSIVLSSKCTSWFTHNDMKCWNTFTSLSVHVCDKLYGERSFSKLKLVKNYLRNTMGQDRLNSLTLLSIEHEQLRKLDFTSVINKFAALKARKKSSFWFTIEYHFFVLWFA